MEEKRASVAERYDNKRNLTQLTVGDVVVMQPIEKNNKLWKEAVVTKQVKSRSYEVTTTEGRPTEETVSSSKQHRDQDGSNRHPGCLSLHNGSLLIVQVNQTKCNLLSPVQRQQKNI